MKKVFALILALAMMLCMAACVGTQDAPEAGNAAADGEKTAADVKIVLLLPGEINDQGWNASNYAGVVACNEQLGTSMEYVEAVQEADFESTFREYEELG